MKEKWLMYRIWLSPSEQEDFVRKLINNKPPFPFSFNRYTKDNIRKDEKPHIQFRFRDRYIKDAHLYLGYYDSKESMTFYKWNAHINTIKTAEIATACALLFMKKAGVVIRPNPFVMANFLHFFLDDLGHTYYDEEILHTHCADFFRYKRLLKNRYEEEE